MGRREWLILLSFVSVACVLSCAGGLLCITSYGVGFYDLSVELHSATPIRAVWYSNGDFDESVRREAEAVVDRRMFVYEPASGLGQFDYHRLGTTLGSSPVVEEAHHDSVSLRSSHRHHSAALSAAHRAFG